MISFLVTGSLALVAAFAAGYAFARSRRVVAYDRAVAIALRRHEDRIQKIENHLPTPE